MELPSRPILNYSQIKNIAEQFLTKRHTTMTIPVPIEEIVEFQLNIRISTTTGLKQSFDIDGFINSAFTEITIDDHVFSRYVERARFTIAHEIGHKVLHENIYKQVPFKTTAEYVSFQDSISQETYKWLEYQANVFAGCVLVPAQALKREVAHALEKKGMHASEAKDVAIPFLEHLPSKFQVSSMTLLNRIEKEGLLKEMF